MDWNEVMIKELQKAHFDVEVVFDDVPKRKKASINSLLTLERDISNQLSVNDAMCAKSLALAATTSLN